MDPSKILITGANGQLGLALQEQYPGARTADSQTLDITNKEALDTFDWSGLTHIVNAAAYTQVDKAETSEGRVQAWAVNANGAANLADIASRHQLTLVHISSDYVFDGTQNNHNEDEELSPLSVYGASKAAGDIAVQLTPKHYTLRTSWVIGEGNNFVRTMAGLAEKDISPTVVHDQIGRLTFTSELVRAIDHLLTNQAPFGTYNVSNSGDSASWADITREIFKNLGRDDLTVTDTTTEEYYKGKSGIAPRPLQSTLDLSKIQTTGFKPRDWQENLVEYLKGENK